VSAYPPLREQRRLHDRRNPLLLAAVCVACVLLGQLGERHLVTVARVPDRSMAPELREGSYAPVCRVCAGEPRKGEIVLAATPAGPRLREIAGLPGEETATLTVPARGALCNPSHWNETEFDALFPLLADELDGAKRDSLRVEMVWTSEGQTIERRVAAADHWLDRYEMRRQATSLASHRLGAEISWNRSVKIGDSLLTEHVWSEDLLMLAPKNAAYSSWLLPKDSVRGRVIALF